MKVCFLWHMHQPYYKDPETGSYALPWVRLHAIKDYVALPRIFREFRNVRHTFNLVPSLLVQVRDYVENNASDSFLDVSRKNALDLTRDEREFILRNFFSAFAPTMILPQPRYAELFRGHEDALRSLERNGGSNAGVYGSSDYTDLVALFNLTWFHPLHREEDPELARLWQKGGRYTEKEKQYILDRQILVMSRMFEEYRRLETEDGGELSSSPMYHPILPLLIDNRSALDARPGMNLPNRPFAYPRDARRQLEEGREIFRELFGAYPKGLWPSEGSISPATLELAAKSGYRWIATDEILLSKALGKNVTRDADGIPSEPEWVYRPYAVRTDAGEIRIVFRDHHLSDLIGFEYSRWDAHDAANNFINILSKLHNKLKSNGLKIPENEFIVPVILDGENAWEYYHDSGVVFLKTLLQKLDGLKPDIECVTLSEATTGSRASEVLPSVPTGSWIDGTFNIWIGHPEDHAAWDMLSLARAQWETRAAPLEAAGTPLPEELKKAESYLFAAEGSDWCWWYGDDHFTPHGPEFDRLFRHNVKAAYLAMGIDPPATLDIPIVRRERISRKKDFIPAPGSYIRPSIDGLITSYLEWSSASVYVPNPEFGSMHRAGRLILSRFYYGFSADVLYFRFDLDPVAVENIRHIDLEILFTRKNRKILGEISLEESASRWSFLEIEAKEPAQRLTFEGRESISATYNKVVEIGIPLDLLDCRADDRMDFFLTIQPKGTLGERWPLYGAFSAELPGADFEERNWSV
ncbi:MAG: glycoside hydrolase family 57 protein [Thermodesulfobacteriota bacterium]